MKRYFALLVAAVLVISCGDSNGGTAPPSPSPTTPAFTPTPTPGGSPEPIATKTPAATPLPQGTRSGIAGVDAVVDAVLARDAEALESLFALTEAPCTHALGSGGPPKCFHHPNQPPEDTMVGAFPLSTCEGEWRTEVSPIVDTLLEHEPELYGVVALNLDTPIWDEPYYPEPEYGVLLQWQVQGVVLGAMLGVEDDGAVTYVDIVCFGPPSFFLTSEAAPAYGEDVELILLGPAYR